MGGGSEFPPGKEDEQEAKVLWDQLREEGCGVSM